MNIFLSSLIIIYYMLNGNDYMKYIYLFILLRNVFYLIKHLYIIL